MEAIYYNELITSNQAGSISNQVIAIEQQYVTGDEQMQTFARFKYVISPDDLSGAEVFSIDINQLKQELENA